MLVKAVYQPAIVSLASAGLNTIRLGIALSMERCSTGWWVGPSSPTPMLSWVNTYVTGSSISEDRRIIGFI